MNVRQKKSKRKIEWTKYSIMIIQDPHQPPPKTPIEARNIKATSISESGLAMIKVFIKIVNLFYYTMI